MLASHRSRRLLAVAAAAGAVLAVAPAASATEAGAAAAGCPKTGGLAFVTTLSNGVTKLGSSATITGSTAKACGVAKFAGKGIVGTIKPANITFAPVTTTDGPLSFPTTLKATSALTGPLTLGFKGDGAAFTGSILATADIYGQSCDIPLTVTLTTGKSGALKGQIFTFDKKGLGRGKLVSNTFAVPAIQSSSTCNLVIATLSNKLLGLPLAAGASSITYDGTLKVG